MYTHQKKWVQITVVTEHGGRRAPNPVYLLDQPLREEARWNLLPEMDNKTRSLVRTELRDWLPAEYRQVRAVDLQQTAAFSPAPACPGNGLCRVQYLQSQSEPFLVRNRLGAQKPAL